MKIVDWLLEGDIVINYLINKYLLDKDFSHNDSGYIGKYLELYDKEKKIWGGNIYHNKWISSTYTLLELKYMEISYDNIYYQEGTKKVLDGLWKNHGKINKDKYQDLCMSAMVLSLVSYGKIKDIRLNEIIDYILNHQMEDGGWNCAWDSVHNKSIVSSIHTTISVLESISDYEKNGYNYRLEELKEKQIQGEEYLLERELFKRLSDGEIIHSEIIKFHYPCRWKYDVLRALEYFTNENHPYDIRMEQGLKLIKKNIKKGYINRGNKYSGKIHFPLETTRGGRFNTFRGLKVLKKYDIDFYKNILNQEFTKIK